MTLNAYDYYMDKYAAITSANCGGISSGYGDSALNIVYGGGSTVEFDALIEALFTLKPKLRRKYKGDAKAFRTDLLWAAQQRKEENATAKLSDLLGIEGGK